MYNRVVERFRFLYKPYALAIVSIGYVLGELGHYLIGKFDNNVYEKSINKTMKNIIN